MTLRARCCTAGLLLCTGLWCTPGNALDIRDYYSPRNRQRPLRKSTTYILLHTTEGSKKGSLRKLRANGETHYLVDRKGRVYRIIGRNRVALHAGRSMWKGQTVLDRYALGIEVVGYHNGSITEAQVHALRELLAELQGIYGVSDGNVLTHSMVAYGAPNRWHKRSHRGRKRCGMLFADRSLRRRLGLTDQPAFDPDVKAGRLAVGDPELARVLYGTARPSRPSTDGKANVLSASRSAWDIARDRYASADTLYVLPDGRSMHGNEITNWRKLPPGTRVILLESESENAAESVKALGRDGDTAQDIAGEEVGSETTIYFLPGGAVKTGAELSSQQIAGLPGGTRMLVGYVYGGYIKAGRSAFDICGPRWNFPSTFYRLPDGTIHPGDAMNEKSIPRQTLVFFQN